MQPFLDLVWLRLDGIWLGNKRGQSWLTSFQMDRKAIKPKRVFACTIHHVQSQWPRFEDRSVVVTASAEDLTRCQE